LEPLAARALTAKFYSRPKGQARHKAEWVKPLRYDDEGQNVGDENGGD